MMNALKFFSLEKILRLFLLFISVFGFSQTQKEIDEILNSTNIREIAWFIRAYPSNVNVPQLKERIVRLNRGEVEIRKTNEDDLQKIQKLKVKIAQYDPVNLVSIKEREKVAEQIQINSKNKYMKTAELLTRLLNGSQSSSKDALVFFKNSTACEVPLIIRGVNNYNITVPARGNQYVILDKGAYRFSGKVCDIEYKAEKDVQEDIIIMLDLDIENNVFSSPR